MKLSNLKLNPEKASGIWHELDIDSQTVKFKIASQKSRAYQNALLKLADEMKLKERLGKKSDISKAVEENRSAALELFATHILLDWQGLEDDEGKQIPYNVELAKQLVDDNVFPDIADFIVKKSNQTELYLGEAVQEDLEQAKNG